MLKLIDVILPLKCCASMIEWLVQIGKSKWESSIRCNRRFKLYMYSDFRIQQKHFSNALILIILSNLASYCYLFTYVFYQKPQECFQKHTEVPWWKITLFSVQLLIFMGHISTFNLSVSNIYLRIQLVHLRQKN